MLDTLSHFILFFCLLRKIILALWLFYIFHSCSLPHYQSCMCPFTSVPPTPRPEKDGSATRVDAVCTYYSESPSTRLDREQLYRELSQETHGITWLYSFTLDRNSLYVNGEWKRYHQSFIAHILDLRPLRRGEDLSLSHTGILLWLLSLGRGIHSQLFQRYIERSDIQRRGLGGQLAEGWRWPDKEFLPPL